jgi:hypothetical protein
MKVQSDVASAGEADQPVFNHARGHANQAQRMRMAAALVTGDVKNTHQLTLGRHDRCRRAGEKVIALQKMLGTVNFNPAGLNQRGPDGIGAAVLFMPGRAATQRHALGLAKKISMAKCVHQSATLVSEDNHALAVPNLFKQEFHHWSRIRQQIVVTSECVTQSGATGMLGLQQTTGWQQTGGKTAPPGTRDTFIDAVDRAVAMFQQMQACLA